MTENYRRKPDRQAGVRITVARYSPPLDRNAFEELRGVAETAGCNGEVREVTFTGGPVLLARYPATYHHGDERETDYAEVEPGEYLAYGHASRNLFATNDEDLAEWYDKEDGEGT